MPKMNLQPRERMTLIIGAVAIFLMIVYWGAQTPLRKYRKSETDLVQARSNLADAQQWQMEATEARSGREQLQKWARDRGTGFDLYTFLNTAVRDLKLGERAKFQTLKTAGEARELAKVRITLNGVNMNELVDLLHRIYSSNNLIALDSMDHLRPAQDNKGLDCQATFISPKIG
ncbi:MAG: type II secretion system protein M [Candidatus Hydrogenedentes bacterium]|nr:type II secretion system protein M [Candidatus Hydrogenedentota bacterium]